MTAPTSEACGSAAPEDLRQTLLGQLEIAWSFAEAFALSDITADVLHWSPSPNCVHVRIDGEHWTADWPDETRFPLPTVTVAWVLWHLEWWLGNVTRVCLGEEPIPPNRHRWTGKVEGVRNAKDRWQQLLKTSDPHIPVQGWMPETVPFSRIAAWVNLELMKNLAEVSQLKILHSNT